MPKMSIVVPVYNTEKYLQRCVNSLIHQTLPEVEIILVDDGSHDSCPQMCDEYATMDERVKVIHKKNAGVSAARNEGLQYATGEYVIFCDSDDWMELNACETLYTAGVQKNADVVVGDINRINGNEVIYNQFFSQEFYYTDRVEMDKLIMAVIYQNYCHLPPTTPTIGYGGPWNKAVKRNFLINNHISFDVSLLGLYDDILYTAYIYANMHSIVYLHKPVYNYVVVPTSITKSFKENSLDISKRIFNAFTKFIQQYDHDKQWEKAFDALVIRRFEECLRLYFFSNKNPKGFKKNLEELKETMASEPYKGAAQRVEIGKLLPHHAKVANLMRMHSATGLWGLYKLKKLRGIIKA